MQICWSRRASLTQPLILGSLFFASANLSVAQAPPPASAPPQVAPAENAAAPPADSNRISIDVVVSDKLGHPIRGLKASDFTLLDNKAPQKLLSFRALDAGTAHAEPTSVVVVLDTINADFSTVARERQELSRFLKQDGGELANPTSVAIFADGGAKMQQGFSRDGNALDALLSQQQTGLRTVTRNTGFWGAAERLEMSLSQLSQLAAYESTLPGRKLILVIGPGWPLFAFAGEQSDMKQRTSAFNSIVQLTNGLRDGHITLYCLDPFDLGRTDPFYYQSYLKGVAAPKDAEYPNLGLQVLAVHSGGSVIINGRDILGELNTAVRDAAASYELTFESAPGDHPDEYHALQVKVDQPDVTVHTTTGYYAHPQMLSSK
jgi:VWFA-related protein